MMMDIKQIAKLKELAQAAENEVIRSHGWAGSVEMLETLRIDEEYLTAASPAAILELIAMAEKQQIAEDAAKAIIAAIGDMPEAERTTAPVSQLTADETPAWLQAPPEGDEAGMFSGAAIVYTEDQLIEFGLKCGYAAAGTVPKLVKDTLRADVAAAPAPIQQEPKPKVWRKEVRKIANELEVRCGECLGDTPDVILGLANDLRLIANAAESRLAEIQRGVEGLTRYTPGLRWGVTGFEGGLSLVSRNEVLALLQPQGQADTSGLPC